MHPQHQKATARQFSVPVAAWGAAVFAAEAAPEAEGALHVAEEAS